jgi:KDO2-lipid IV(A) lauroyltransferase
VEFREDFARRQKTPQPAVNHATNAQLKLVGQRRNRPDTLTGTMTRPAQEISTLKRLRFRAEASALRALAWLIPKFSRRTVLRFSHGLGWLAYYALAEQRRIARANLDTAFGDNQSPTVKHRIARASTHNFVATMLGLFWSPRLTRSVIEETVEFDPESLKRLHELLTRGKGIIGITMHYGDWELLGLAMPFFEIPMTVVQDATNNPALGEILAQLRGVTGNRIIPNHRAAAKLMKSLKRGEFIALLIDQHVSRRHGGEWLDFFGLPVSNTPAIGWLALRSGAPIVPFVAHPLPGGRIRIGCGNEIPYTATTDSGATMHSINQQCMELCEAVIRKQPEPWLWSYKRWKSRPTREQGRFPYYSRASRIDVTDASD